ncbi:2-succinyl-6-hydroxy-2,4-cyclohexadiene-1-carboxylate synthase [Bacillus spongiae]|uniref:Putative 2-succinyl-6-hydroxy-2,4-cyclohexadiene-1-carboxylate synthase n=1 Tax=Bacillus spongiae TaxID=2683610 RepID=A0ABU8HHA2_9BACI
MVGNRRIMKIIVNNTEYTIKMTGKGEPIVFLHGFTGDHSTWGEIIPFLSNSFQCITIDLLGHGQTTTLSQPDDYTMEKSASDIVLILKKLNIDKAHLIGYSMGGRLALGFTILHPSLVKTLILESASPGLKLVKEREKRREADAALARRIKQEGVAAFVDYWENIPLFRTQKRLPTHMQERIRKQRLKNSEKGLINSLLGMGTGQQPSYWEKLHEVQCGVLLLTGSLDEKFNCIALEMEKILPNVQYIQVENAGHAIHVEQSKKFGTIVKEFLLHKGGS